MKRILFVTKNLGLGGAEKHVVDLSNGLCEKGVAVAIFVFNTKGEKAARVNDLGPEIQIISPSENIERPSLLMGTWEVLKTAWKWKPDVLCSMLWNTKSMVAIAGQLLGIKTVLVESSSPLYEVARKKHRSLAVFYRKTMYGLANTVVAVSRGVARETRELYGLNRVETVHNGIDIGHIKKRAETDSDGTPHEYFSTGFPVLVTVGGFREPKGYNYLLEAFSMVNESAEARLIMIGDGKLRGELCRTAESLGIQNKIAMVGETEPYVYLRHSDVFVLSSLWEGFPLVLLEAASLGLPIVSTNCNYGPEEIIQDGENGLLVPVADPAKMASEILRLLKNEKLRSDMGTEAEKRAERFSLDSMVCGYEEIFLNL